MKICPTCQTTYDDSQNFCLNDGAVLKSAPPQVELLDAIEENTVVHRAPTPDLSNSRFNPPPAKVFTPTAPVTPPIVVEKKSNTSKIIALTALGTILLVALAAGGVYLALQNRDNREIAQVNQNANARPRNANAAVATNANANANANANVNANANASPSPSPSPKPTLDEAQAKAIRRDVSDTLDGWKNSTENADINQHVGYYAPTVDFYNAKSASVDRVRADRERAFETYPTIEISLDNVKITPDPAGDKAVVVLDKTWRFENDETTSEGKVQQQLTLEKRGNRWLITGEKDLKQYHSSKY